MSKENKSLEMQPICNFLDENIVDELGRFVMENANYFIYDEKNRGYYNLLCVVVDRLKASVIYLNENSSVPQNEAQLITFMTYACMVHDAIGELKTQTLYRETHKRYKDGEKKYFKDVCVGQPWFLTEDECLTDEEFFAHFRSLVFAHPYKTDRRKIIEEKFGVQYSPWVIVNSHFHPNKIGVTIYSEKTSETQMLTFEFHILKEYIKYRYSKIIEIQEWFEQMIQEKKDEINRIKTVRTDDCIDTLHSVLEVLQKRCQSFYGRIETLIDFLTYEESVKENKEYIEKYQEAIRSIIPSLCDAIDNADYEKAHTIIDSVLNNYCNNSKVDYCISKVSDAYYGSENNLERFKPLIEDALKSLQLKLKIDDNPFEIVGIFMLLCAVCYFTNKEASK